MAKSNRATQRGRNVEAVGHLYKKKFRWLKTCVYCGMNATDLEHVLPLSVCASLDFDKIRIRDIMFGLYVVPSCYECNSLASNKIFLNIKDKRKYIQNRLRTKHRKKLRHVVWDDEEIKELGRAMQDQIRQSMYNKFILTKRIIYPEMKDVIYEKDIEY